VNPVTYSIKIKKERCSGKDSLDIVYGTIRTDYGGMKWMMNKGRLQILHHSPEG